ncbi:MAG TPA: hypothetical protein VGZ73_18945 [Bryobacteraceae bacterium]|nr:hypothetical protein [Bryobacteraceae bacterium]
MRVRGLFLSAQCALLLLLAMSAPAAAPGDLDALIAAARSAPAEFSSDALIRIAALDQIERDRRIELLEQAFQHASGAQQPYKRHATPLRTDGSVGYWNRVYSQDLDGLSLRLRAVESMLPLDKVKARELFLQIPPPNTPRLTCEDSQVYDVGRFYEVLANVAQTFAGKESEANEANAPFRLLHRYSGAFTSPVQAAPLAHALATAKVTDDDFRTLTASFGAALGKVAGDDRSFVYSVALGKEIQALVEESKRRHVSPLPLLEGYRLYLVVNLSANRCADDDLMQGGKPSFGVFSTQPAEEPTGDFVTFFNDKLRIAPLQPIQEQEATPARLEGVAAGQRICQDAECRAIVDQMRGLLMSPSGSPYLPAEREKPEWQAKLRAVLSALSDWKESGKTTPAEYFREKCAAYGELVGLALNGSNREPVLHAILEFVSGNRFQTANRVEWFLPVNALVGRVGLDPLGLGKFAAELRKANDPVIALYANLEALAPRAPDRILALL